MLNFLRMLGETVGVWLYVIAGGLAFAEAAVLVGVVFPGETALLVAGFGAHQGWISLWPMIAVAVVCAVLGDTVGYEVGRYWGPAVRESRAGRWVGESRWSAADEFLHRHGGKAVFLGRLTALLRALTPGMAGMARMPYLRTFLPWNVAGGLLWGAGCVLLGYGFAASLETVSTYLTWAPVPIVILVLGLLVLLEVRKRRQHAAVAAERQPEREPEPAEAE